MRYRTLGIVTVLVAGVAFARADLVDAFAGFDSVSEIGVSGLASSYHDDTSRNRSVTGDTTGNYLPTFGSERISYPNGIGQVPSPGGSVGQQFDQGVLGIQVNENALIVKLATAINARTGVYHSGWNTWYGQGDVFLDVEDDAGVRHYALLSAWAQDDRNQPVRVNRGKFNRAQRFHQSGRDDDGSLEGYLVELDHNNEVAISGGRGAYNSRNAPDGLDMRVFAQRGTPMANANLTHDEVTDMSQPWYIQTWAFDLSHLSSDDTFGLALHSGASCGNDQIGASFEVPEPSSALLLGFGAAGVTWLRRR